MVESGGAASGNDFGFEWGLLWDADHDGNKPSHGCGNGFIVTGAEHQFGIPDFGELSCRSSDCCHFHTSRCTGRNVLLHEIKRQRRHDTLCVECNNISAAWTLA